MEVLKDSGGTLIAVTKSVKRKVRGGGVRHQHHTAELDAVVEFAEGAVEIIIVNRNQAQPMFVNGSKIPGANSDGQFFQEVRDVDLDQLPTFEVTGTALAFQAVIVY